MPSPFVPTFDFSHAPVLWNWMNDDSLVRIIIGPVGSGKTVGCCVEVMRRAMQQTPDADGIRRFKVAVVRNTMPMLRSTTIKTWLEVFPEDACGNMRQTAPVSHPIKVRPKNWITGLAPDHPDQGTPGLDLFVEFMALDNARDVKKLLSYEGDMIWFNEVREIPRALIDAAGDRIGRRASNIREGSVGADWFGIIADTNPSDEDSWLFDTSLATPSTWLIVRQPMAVVEVARAGQYWVSTEQQVPFTIYDERHIVKQNGIMWATNPHAENLPNHQVSRVLDPTGDPLGPGGYYQRNIPGKSTDHIRLYYQAKFGYVQEGKPVVPDFVPEIHVVDDLPWIDGPLGGGIDVGGGTLNPAGVFGQQHPRGIWMCQFEVVASNMGVDNFSMQINQSRQQYASAREWGQVWGDPAAAKRDEIFENVVFDHMQSKGVPVMPAETNDIALRVAALKAPFGRMIDGKPGILIHRRCKTLIAGLAGKYDYRRMQVVGEERYAEKPTKRHPYSDVCEATGYWFLGGGEMHSMRGRGSSFGDAGGGSEYNAQVDFDVFGG